MICVNYDVFKVYYISQSGLGVVGFSYFGVGGQCSQQFKVIDIGEVLKIQIKEIILVGWIGVNFFQIKSVLCFRG